MHLAKGTFLYNDSPSFCGFLVLFFHASTNTNYCTTTTTSVAQWVHLGMALMVRVRLLPTTAKKCCVGFFFAQPSGQGAILLKTPSNNKITAPKNRSY